jgi:hypothetical protein
VTTVIDDPIKAADSVSPSLVEHFLHMDPYFYSLLLGCLLVAFTAWQRFNEPSFPDQKNLPHALEPLRYLFLGAAYKKARCAYLATMLLLYWGVVGAGPSIAPALHTNETAWALAVALYLIGVGQAPQLKWLNVIEVGLRRCVHAWFLVPHGIEETIGLLEDARYEPPASHLKLIPSPLRERLRDNLGLPVGSVKYRWARCRILMQSLEQMGSGAEQPLRKASFDPFGEDFETISRSIKALQKDLEPAGDQRADENTEASLARPVDALLRKIYAYISWGVRPDAASDQQVDQTLEELGFRVPLRGGRRLFDIVAPAVCIVAVITMAFWLIHDSMTFWLFVGPKSSDQTWQVIVQNSLSGAVAAGLMYGSVAFIALGRRADRIMLRTWDQHSARCFMPLAFRAGLVTWFVIIVSSMLGEPDWQSLIGIWKLIGWFLGATSKPTLDLTGIYTALPWFCAGMIVSVFLAKSLGGDMRRTDRHQKQQDAIVLGILLGLTAAVAQSIQVAVGPKSGFPYGLIISMGLAGGACGWVIGFMVPYACRETIVRPRDRNLRRALQELLTRAEKSLGSPEAAEDWVFMPHSDLSGITPAEAYRYKTRANGVLQLLEDGAAGPPEGGRDRLRRQADAVSGATVQHLAVRRIRNAEVI